MTTTLALSGLSAPDRTKPKRLQVLLVGPHGSRKTVTAHAMPGTRTLDFDNGMQSVEWAILAGKLPKAMNEIAYRTILPKNPGEEGMMKMMNDATDQVDAWIAEEDVDPAKWNRPYPQFWDTLIVDGCSFLQDGVQALALKENERVDLSKSLIAGQKGITASQKKHGLYIVPMRIQDWGSMGNLWMKLVRQWQALGKNLILTAHEYAEMNEDTNTVISYQPNVVGQMRQKLPGAFDEVWFMKVRSSNSKEADPTVLFRVKIDDKRQAKTRLGCLASEEEADFEKIKAKVADFYKVKPELLWKAYHGTKGREQAESELASEAITI